MPVTKTRLEVHRLPLRLTGDARRTITRLFLPGDAGRARRIIDRVMGLDEYQVDQLLEGTIKEFGQQHNQLDRTFEENFQQAIQLSELDINPSRKRRQLIGSYFTMEYAYESAALFNPSMVPARDQSSAPPGGTRFVMSLRAIGEGHISSIVFRRGTIAADGEITLDPVPLQSRRMTIVKDRTYEKKLFRTKLIEMSDYSDKAEDILLQLDEFFTYSQLTSVIERTRSHNPDSVAYWEIGDRMTWLARSNYQVRPTDGTDLTEIVIFPLSESEAEGMEDMRLVRFSDDDGSIRYFGTYTAFNGSQSLPQILEAQEDVAEVHTLNGRFARNKGMALFPRRIDGQYMMIGRVDGETMQLLWSDNVRFWNEGKMIQAPRFPWEFVQIGNCGSPIETEAGWLLLTHGVGSMRRYCIGASLLDLEDPSRVIGQLDHPLLTPMAEERAGYVPNVVYSCGAMAHNGLLVIPYGISDAATGFATVPLDDLIQQLLG